MVKLHNKPMLGMGIYTPPDISLILKVPQSRIRWFIKEVWDNRFGQRVFGERYSWDMDNHKAVNFLVLAEFEVVLQLRRSGLSTRRILRAREAIALDLKQPYPFATSTLLFHPRKIWYKLEEMAINADESHQLNFLSFVEKYCKRIDFTANLASRIWPNGRGKSIVVDPHHQFGQPVINGTNIMAETIYVMHEAGEPISRLSQLYEVSEKKIQDAIDFYRQAA